MKATLALDGPTLAAGLALGIPCARVAASADPPCGEARVAGFDAEGSPDRLPPSRRSDARESRFSGVARTSLPARWLAARGPFAALLAGGGRARLHGRGVLDELSGTLPPGPHDFAHARPSLANPGAPRPQAGGAPGAPS